MASEAMCRGFNSLQARHQRRLRTSGMSCRDRSAGASALTLKRLRA